MCHCLFLFVFKVLDLNWFVYIMVCFMKLEPEKYYSVFNNVNVTLSGLHCSGVPLCFFFLKMIITYRKGSSCISACQCMGGSVWCVACGKLGIYQDCYDFSPAVKYWNTFYNIWAYVNFRKCIYYYYYVFIFFIFFTAGNFFFNKTYLVNKT